MKDTEITLALICSYSRQHQSVTESLFIQEVLTARILELGYKLNWDGAGNLWVFNGTAEEYPYLFACHIDTVDSYEGRKKLKIVDDILQLHEEEEVHNCLGADDGVGIYCNLRMLEAGVKGTYLFSRGEECGLIGASHAATMGADVLSQYKLCVEVDRQGTFEIITEQASGLCASDAFADALALQLGMGHAPSPFGVYTDNSEFNHLIPENVNIAAGYQNQHRKTETVDLAYVEKLVAKLIQVDWSLLPIKRDVNDLGFSPTIASQNYNSKEAFKSKPVLDFDDCLELVEAEPEALAWWLYSIGVTWSEVEEPYYGEASDEYNKSYNCGEF